jgi:hypothetical protein
LALIAASVVLFAARDTIIRRVTSKSLGSLAPGFAAGKLGYAVYAALLGDFGLVVLGFGLGNVYLIMVSVALFVCGSIAGIAGEVAVYRNLKR